MIYLKYRTWLPLIVLALFLCSGAVVGAAQVLSQSSKDSTPAEPTAVVAQVVTPPVEVTAIPAQITATPVLTPYAFATTIPEMRPAYIPQTPIPESVLTVVPTPEPTEVPAPPVEEPAVLALEQTELIDAAADPVIAAAEEEAATVVEEVAAEVEVPAQPEVAAAQAEAAPAPEPEPEVEASVPYVPSGGRVIVLDPGHGGSDPGVASGAVTGLPEKDVTMQIASAAKYLLELDGYTVVLTRDGDTDANAAGSDLTGDGMVDIADEMQARADAANWAGGDLLISVHLNSAERSSANGTETFYCGDREFADYSWHLASLLQQSTSDWMATLGYYPADRGVIEDSDLYVGQYDHAHLAILGPASWIIPRPTEMPAVLWEPLFMSNPADDSILSTSEGIWALAQALRLAVNQYYEIYP